MMKPFTILFAVIVVLAADTFAQPCADSVNRVAFTHSGKNYYLIKQKEGYSDAEFCAAELGGHLVYINDQAEQTAVYNAITSAGISTTYVSVFDGGGKAYIWIGANDIAKDGDWRWGAGANAPKFWNGQGTAGTGGGTAVGGAYHNWGGKSTGTAREPDNYGNFQNVAAICLSSWPNGVAGEWNDIQGSNLLYYVVEYESTNAEELKGAHININVYPNPASDKLIIETRQRLKNGVIQIISADGRVFINEPVINSFYTVSLTNIPSGIYYVRVLERNNQVFAKPCYINH